MNESTGDAAELSAALDVVYDADDYDFFFGLFDEPLPSDDTTSDATDSDASVQTTASASSHRASSARSDRRRQRWSTAPEASDLSVVLRLPPPSAVKTRHARTAHEALAHAWADVAKSQKRERHAAEKENAMLREMLRQQQQTVHKIFKLTHKVGALAESLPRVESTTYLGPVLPLDQVCEQLELLVVGADAVLASGAFASDQQEFREIQYRRVDTAGGGALQVEVDMAWLVPFPVHEVAEATRTQLSRMTPKEIIYSAEEVHRDAELIVSHVVAGPKEDDCVSAVIHTMIATRCLPPAPDGSVLLVMKSCARFVKGCNSWVGSSDGEGYIRVTKVNGNLSRIAFCRRSRAEPPANANLSPAERSKWMDVAIQGPMRGSEKRVDKVVQALENLLLTSSSKE